jgi:FdhD protein
MDEFIVRPDPSDQRLTRRVTGQDEQGRTVETSVVSGR